MKLSRLSFFTTLVVGAVALLLTGIAPLRASAPNVEPFVPPSSFRAADLTAGSQQMDRFIEKMYSKADGSTQIFLDGAESWAGAAESTADDVVLHCGEQLAVAHSGVVSGVGTGANDGEALQAAIDAFLADLVAQLPAFSCKPCPSPLTGTCLPYVYIEMSLVEISVHPINTPLGQIVVVTIKYEGPIAVGCTADCNY